MANYKLSIFFFRGHSKNDTIPNAVTYPGYYRYDTDTEILYYSNGIEWRYVRTGAMDFSREKTGGHPCTSPWQVDGWGLLKDLQGYGSMTNNVDGNGSSQRFRSGTTANSTTGVALITPVAAFSGWMRLNNLPFFRNRVFMDARLSNDSRFFNGWFTSQAHIPHADNPMDVNNGGILVGWGTLDTNIMIFYGPGDGVTTPPAPIDTGLAVPTVSGVSYNIEMLVFSATEVRITIERINAPAANYTTTLTTNMPSGVKSINFHDIMQTPTGIDKQITFYSGYMRSAK